MNQLTSIIDSGNISQAFIRILSQYDPNRGKNHKSSILDCSNFFTWAELDYKLFNITKTRNLTGTATQTKYDLIIFEPNDNQTKFAKTIEYCKTFNNVINIGGCVIVKVKDYKENINGQQHIKGSFDVKLIFEANDFYLENNIVFKNSNQYNQQQNSDIQHSYFMIFKKKNPT